MISSKSGELFPPCHFCINTPLKQTPRVFKVISKSRKRKRGGDPGLNSVGEQRIPPEFASLGGGAATCVFTKRRRERGQLRKQLRLLVACYEACSKWMVQLGLFGVGKWRWAIGPQCCRHEEERDRGILSERATTRLAIREQR